MTCLHTVIWYQVFRFNTNNFQVDIRLINQTLTGTTTTGESGAGNNSKENQF